MVGAVRGYRVIVVMPDNMSRERQQLVKAYGAEVVLTPAENDLAGAIEKAAELLARHPRSWMPDQFTNPANPEFHAQTTAQEIIEQMGKLDAFIAGVGTGGTLTGVTRVLKEVYPELRAYAVEPAESAVISGGRPGPHCIQGIGDGFIPANLDLSVIDGVIPVAEAEATEMTRRLAREEGILGGISSGAAVVAACRAAERMGPGKRLLAILPDTGERYLSMEIFD
jgi:cysteine synthase A